jgi:hypothetical protein
MGGVFLLVLTLPKGLTIFILSFVGVIFFCSYMTRLTSLAKVKVTIDEDSISIKWLEQFIFSKKPDVTISLNEVAAYTIQSDVFWNWLTIEMKDGSIYKIWRGNFPFRISKDDYSEFVSAFISSVKKYKTVIMKSSGISPKFYRSTKR